MIPWESQTVSSDNLSQGTVNDRNLQKKSSKLLDSKIAVWKFGILEKAPSARSIGSLNLSEWCPDIIRYRHMPSVISLNSPIQSHLKQLNDLLLLNLNSTKCDITYLFGLLWAVKVQFPPCFSNFHLVSICFWGLSLSHDDGRSEPVFAESYFGRR